MLVVLKFSALGLVVLTVPTFPAPESKLPEVSVADLSAAALKITLLCFTRFEAGEAVRTGLVFPVLIKSLRRLCSATGAMLAYICVLLSATAEQLMRERHNVYRFF